jgi:uncharacterized protein (TIGR04255 family)
VLKRSPSLILEHAPLVYFIAQIRFAEILTIGEHVPAIQDALRHSGFPVFKQAVIKGIKLDAGGMIKLDEREIWHFENVETTAGIVLARDFVTLQTTTYDRFATTLPPFIGAVKKIHQAVEINVLQRCGLRYVDVVHPKLGESFATYLRPEIIGISSSIDGVSPRIQSSSFTGASECGTLTVRFGTGYAPNVMPADLLPITLKLSHPFNEGDPIGTLDLDHYVERQETFSPERAEGILGELHDACSRAFLTCVTPAALQRWGQRDV